MQLTLNSCSKCYELALEKVWHYSAPNLWNDCTSLSCRNNSLPAAPGMKWVAVVEVGGEQKSRRTGGKGNRVWGITSIMGEDIKNQRHYAFYHYAHASSLDDPCHACSPYILASGTGSCDRASHEVRNRRGSSPQGHSAYRLISSPSDQISRQ